MPNPHDHVAAAELPDAAGGSMPLPSPIFKLDTTMWESSPQGWLENMVDVVLPEPDDMSS